MENKSYQWQHPNQYGIQIHIPWHQLKKGKTFHVEPNMKVTVIKSPFIWYKALLRILGFKVEMKYLIRVSMEEKTVDVIWKDDTSPENYNLEIKINDEQ